MTGLNTSLEQPGDLLHQLLEACHSFAIACAESQCTAVSGVVAHASFDQCTTTSDKVWTLNDLQALHELRVPVVVAVPSITEAPHRYNEQSRPSHDISVQHHTCAVETQPACLLAGPAACCQSRAMYSRMLNFFASTACQCPNTSFLIIWTTCQKLLERRAETGS